MPPSPSLHSLRLTLFAAAGLGFAACAGERLTPGAQSGSNTGTSSGDTSSASSGGGQGGAGGAGGTGGQGGAPFVDPVCEGAELVLTAMGAPTGFARCPDGTFHRLDPVPCDATLLAPPCTGGEQIVSCAGDADCTAGPNGRCAVTIKPSDEGLTSICACRYPCSNDEECGPGKACVCGGFLGLDEDWSTCAPASCARAADCPSGECGLSIYDDGCSTLLALGCRAESDACRLNESCAPDAGSFPQCILPEETPAIWSCVGIDCQLGRPLRIDGAARTAPSEARADFLEALSPSLDGLSPSLRAALGEHWLRAASLEHASVGSFARFTLELLSLGAPPELLAEAQQAALDELEHARLAYGLASAYAGEALGPGPLSLAGLSLAADRPSILRALIEEGCVGEALAAAEALALGAQVGDPVVARVLARIAEDEARHAALAWRTLAWMLRAAREEELRRCAAFFQAAIAEAAAPRGSAFEAPEHGLLGGEALGRLRSQALREVVAPCAEALLGAREQAGSPAAALSAA